MPHAGLEVPEKSNQKQSKSFEQLLRIMGNKTSTSSVENPADSISAFTLEVDRPDGVYYAGEMVRGKVTMVTSKDISYRGIHITFYGYGKMKHDFVQVVSGGGKGSSREVSRTAIGNKVYVNQRVPLLGSEAKESSILPAGAVEHFFAFTMRSDLPGSTDERVPDGFSYSVIASIDFGNNRESSVSRPVVILASRPLPSPALLRAKEHKGRPRKLSILWFLPCFPKDDVTIDVKLLRQAFAPGETLDFHLRVNNNTNSVFGLQIDLLCCTHLCGTYDSLFHKNLPHTADSVETFSLYNEAVKQHTVFEIGHDPSDSNFGTSHEVAATIANPPQEIASLNSVRKVLLPQVPLSFCGLPNLAGADPITRAYYVIFTVGRKWSVSMPVVICAVPPSPAALQSAHLSNQGVPPIQQGNTDGGNPFRLPYSMEFTPEPVSRVVHVAASATLNIAVAIPSDPVVSLMNSLRSSADLRATVRAWATQYPTAARDLSPESLQRVLQSIPVDTDQVAVAHELAQLVHCCTCAHVVVALEVCPSLTAEVASSMVPYVRDTENKVFVLGLLPESVQNRVAALFAKE